MAAPMNDKTYPFIKKRERLRQRATKLYIIHKQLSGILNQF